ncbi:hypothetical protein H5407_23320, partial [Mitsuaria sp. WAJ17]|uniref:hypothetical protein n=1 Tax=Mitsuaria sp. WAJ17 TaxID=2761452 RepID=UPI00179A4405
WPELPGLAAGVGLPVLSTPLAELQALPPRPGLRVTSSVEAMAQALDALLKRPRAVPSKQALAAQARCMRARERALVRALTGLLTSARHAEQSGAQQAPPSAVPRPGDIVTGASGGSASRARK